MLISPRVRDREFDRIPAGRLFQEDARMNYRGIGHHRQYSHMTLMDEKRNILWSGKVAHLRSGGKEPLDYGASLMHHFNR
jgi:hypothetical protein